VVDLRFHSWNQVATWLKIVDEPRQQVGEQLLGLAATRNRRFSADQYRSPESSITAAASSARAALSG
jgi:hypothetical protein